MSHTYSARTEITIRRKGGKDKATIYFGVPCGDRRTRQIAVRHYLRKEEEYINSQSGYRRVTIHNPGSEKIINLVKEVSW